ncbi:16S rRNA (guanine(527)-N(7))-methyltransferase RsmG [Zeimonas arvi]|uniref:Ribosomal RNA small subunit methyltransferase G n=1 Tax=Zeimonas arvi TaxID=2498847 RepID=A0A5C8NUF5_9BURK|nr:16S rRNA (guanine(527)-N(7))-methyltransferase RsmG [Zeimonas arvi]TXL64801.1 16S rRNA (guanine(527)-N(7))-methyltransferase RsmG [Zeimonas arvi]
MSSSRSARVRRAPSTSLDRGALERELAAGLARLHLDLPDAATGKLLDYLALLSKWNAVYNLTAVREPRAMLIQHLLDSLAIVAPLATRGAAPGHGGEGTGAARDSASGEAPGPVAPYRCVVDVGSGGGLPGIVLAIVWPRTRIHLVEPVGKKAAFLRQCVVELALAHVEVHASRIEALEPGPDLAPDLILCRAFASLPDFVSGIDALVGPSTIVAAMKGGVPRDEIAALGGGWSVAEILPLQVPLLDAERHLLLLERRADPGTRARSDTHPEARAHAGRDRPADH